jgi:hypothetical protein
LPVRVSRANSRSQEGTKLSAGIMNVRPKVPATIEEEQT